MIRSTSLSQTVPAGTLRIPTSGLHPVRHQHRWRFGTVETRRVFRNVEAHNIDATLTFPLPVKAALFTLEAAHDGRRLRAMVRKRANAREVYEGAVEEGKAADLHEELLRGMHMLSVAHIAPGAEIAVTARWATTLTAVNDRWQLCIPLPPAKSTGSRRSRTSMRWKAAAEGHAGTPFCEGGAGEAGKPGGATHNDIGRAVGDG